MNCPPEIASIVLRLIGVGLLRIRALSHDADRCMAEGDHIHNLPDLVLNFEASKLSYDWEVEKPLFIDHPSTTDLAGFPLSWDDLRAHTGSLAIAGTC